MSKQKNSTIRIVAAIFVALALLLYLIYPMFKGKSKIGGLKGSIGMTLPDEGFRSGDSMFKIA